MGHTRIVGVLASLLCAASAGFIVYAAGAPTWGIAATGLIVYFAVVNVPCRTTGIEDVRSMSVKSGDTVVLTADIASWTPSEIEHLNAHLRSAMPEGVRTCVLEKGITLTSVTFDDEAISRAVTRETRRQARNAARMMPGRAEL